MTEKLSSDAQYGFIDENYKRITENIAAAAVKSGRNPQDITFMAVTKTVSPALINHALSLGIRLIGENKVQELLSKLEFLNTDGLDMHIIGHLQSNKVRKIVGTVSMIQSVDSVALAGEISLRSVNAGVSTDILLEVNIGGEASKTGFAYGEVLESAFEAAEMPGVKVKGFMAVPPVCAPDDARRYFAKIHTLFSDAKSKMAGKAEISVLSLGMSADYAEAIEEGATLVRVGSALFGARRY